MPPASPPRPAWNPSSRDNGLAANAAGDLFIGTTIGNEDDGVRAVVQRLDQATGTITTVAGHGSAFCQHPVADGQMATAGCLREIYAIASGGSGDLLLSSLGVIRKVDAANGTISTLAGRPTDPEGSDPCCDGCFDPPECVRALDLAIDPAGQVVIADRDKRIVERLHASDAPSCDDGDVCTIDIGDPATGCRHARARGRRER